MTTLPNLQANKELVRRYYQIVSGDLSGIDAIVTAGFVDHHFPPDTPAGPDGVRHFFGRVLPTFSCGLRVEIDFLLADGERVDCHFVVYFRHTGEFAGLPPTGKEIRVPAISTFRIADGKLAEAWELFDSGDMLRQMGAKG